MKRTIQSAANTLYSKEAGELLRKYAAKLIASGYGFTRRQLKEMDYVDIQAFFKREGNVLVSRQDYVELVKTIPSDQYFYYMMPCFKEGTFYLGANQYIYWKVKDISVEERQYTVFLMEHGKLLGTWLPGNSGTFRYTIGKDKFSVEVEMFKSTDLLQVVEMLPAKAVGWTKYEAEGWNNFLKIFRKKNKNIDNVETLSLPFLKWCTFLNYRLQSTKVSRPQKAPPKPSGNREYTIDIEETPKRMVRTVGDVQIRSEKPPRKPSSSITYHVGAWKTRGHIRHYKNGKTVFIQETVHHRKKLSGNPAHAKLICK